MNSPQKNSPRVKVTLIVSTYNWPGALNLCLLSIKNQLLLPDEVIIADDGSGEETEFLINTHAKDFPVPLLHVWQEDHGFQLSKIRNKAIAKATGDYIVQIDGDLILDRHFIKDHLKFSRPNTFVSGSRVIMTKALSTNLLQNESIAVSLFSKGIVNIFNGVRVALLSRLLDNYKRSDIYYLRGCNMAFWRADLVKVNGYNEAFAGWGREDNEIGLRLINAGVQKRIIKFSGIVFHLYHPEKVRSRLDINDEILQNTATEGLNFCDKGLNQYT